MDDYFSLISQLVRTWGPWLIFAAVFVECIPIIGLAVPGIIIIVLAGFLSAQESWLGGLTLFAAALAGIVLSDSLAYTAGRLGNRLTSVSTLIDRHRVLRDELLAQHPAVLLLYQFPPYSRMLAPLLLGAAGFRPVAWTALVATSATLFVGCFFLIGHVAGRAGQGLLAATNAARIVSMASLAAFGLWVAWMVIRLVRARHKHGSGLTK